MVLFLSLLVTLAWADDDDSLLQGRRITAVPEAILYTVKHSHGACDHRNRHVGPAYPGYLGSAGYGNRVNLHTCQQACDANPRCHFCSFCPSGMPGSPGCHHTHENQCALYSTCASRDGRDAHSGYTTYEVVTTTTTTTYKVVTTRTTTTYEVVTTTTTTVGVCGGSGGINLGTAGNFAILSKSGVTSTGTTNITGDVGTSPIAATGITGFGLVLDRSTLFSTSSLVSSGSKVYAADYIAPTSPMLTLAVLHMQAAFVDTAGRVPADKTELDAGNIAGRTLSPGIYKWGTNVNVAQSLTFSGTPEDVWIMQIAGNLVFASGSAVVLSGGAKAENIFWQVSGYTRFGTYSHAEGVFLCMTKIVFQTGSSLNGAALAQTAVTLDAATIVKGGCSHE